MGGTYYRSPIRAAPLVVDGLGSKLLLASVERCNSCAGTSSGRDPQAYTDSCAGKGYKSTSSG